MSIVLKKNICEKTEILLKLAFSHNANKSQPIYFVMKKEKLQFLLFVYVSFQKNKIKIQLQCLNKEV